MRQINEYDFDALISAAKKSDRKRAHRNLHSSYDDKVQRILIGLVKGSYVAPHYHSLPHQWEMFTLLNGQLKICLYNQQGEVTDTKVIDSVQSAGQMIEFSPNEIHSVECLSEEAIMLEIKEGPFRPECAKTFPIW